MKVKVTAVYANLPLPTTESVELILSDAIIVLSLLDKMRKYQNGDIKSPFIKITFKDSDISELQRQGIQTEGLTHFVYEINRAN